MKEWQLHVVVEGNFKAKYTVQNTLSVPFFQIKDPPYKLKDSLSLYITHLLLIAFHWLWSANI